MHVQSYCFADRNLLLFAVLVDVAVVNENGEKKKQLVQIGKTKTLPVRHALLCITLPSLPDVDVKLPNFTFLWSTSDKTAGTTLFFFS